MSESPQKQPNIVYFHVDNRGLGELGCYGGGILRGADTKNIDSFAGDSLKLSHFVVEPQCTPCLLYTSPSPRDS